MKYNIFSTKPTETDLNFTHSQSQKIVCGSHMHAAARASASCAAHVCRPLNALARFSYPALPRSFFTCNSRLELYTSLSRIPDTVKTPPMIAHKLEAKWPEDFFFSLYFTITGA